MSNTLDVYVEDHGSIVQFEPRTEEARQWFDENVQAEGWQWLGNRLCVDHRLAKHLREGIQIAGLQIN